VRSVLNRYSALWAAGLVAGIGLFANLVSGPSPARVLVPAGLLGLLGVYYRLMRTGLGRLGMPEVEARLRSGLPTLVEVYSDF
jgi:hypothetical protein